jgi:hypothetical protein
MVQFIMKDVPKKPKRPFLITLMSILSVYAGLMFLYQAFLALIVAFAISDMMRFIVGGIIFLSIGIGLWLMKKWAVHLYTLSVIVNLIVLLLAGKFDVWAVVYPGIVVVIGYIQFSKMS